jgi:hypothetical protein
MMKIGEAYADFPSPFFYISVESTAFFMGLLNFVRPDKI